MLCFCIRWVAVLQCFGSYIGIPEFPRIGLKQTQNVGKLFCRLRWDGSANPHPKEQKFSVCIYTGLACCYVLPKVNSKSEI